LEWPSPTRKAGLRGQKKEGGTELGVEANGKNFGAVMLQGANGVDEKRDRVRVR